MINNAPPKVFISHASEDKDRFVHDFAEQLRIKHSVDVWLDTWEMKPGDSLVKKIYKGIEEAQAVIIVLSSISVQKPWVQAELDASVVKKITDKLKLIPVVIDDCQIPESLKSTVWQRIKTLDPEDDSYQKSLCRIVSAIFGTDNPDKPPIGGKPLADLLGEKTVDVLREIYRLQVDENNNRVIFEHLHKAPELTRLPKEALIDSLKFLEKKNLIHGSKAIGYSYPLQVVLTDSGFQQFAKIYIQGYEGVVKRISALLVNERIFQSDKLASRVDKPIAFVNFVLNLMEKEGHIKISKAITTDDIRTIVEITRISLELLSAGK